jgi:hypothetical protein
VIAAQMERLFTAIGDGIIYVGTSSYRNFDALDISSQTHRQDINMILSNFSDSAIRKQALLNFDVVIPKDISKSELFAQYILAMEQYNGKRSNPD